MDEVRDGLREHALCHATAGRLGMGAQDPVELRHRQESELGQHPRQVGVVDVHPVLEEGEGRRHGRVEPDARSRRLAQLGAVDGSEEGPAQRMGGGTLATPDEIDARQDVAPLVRAAHLQLAAVVPVEVVVVVGLQQHVAELGVGDAMLPRHPSLHALPGDHLVDRDVLADVTQEVQEAQLPRPVEVVHQRPGPLWPQDSGDLGLDGGHVGRERLDVEQVPLL